MSNWYEILLDVDGNEIELTVEKLEVEFGRSFSADALSGLHDQMIAYVGTRIMRRWNETGEPPTFVRVEMRVTVG